MSIDKTKEKVIPPVSLNEIKKELNDTFDIFLKLHTVQLVVSYALGHLTEELDEDKHSFVQDILFGSRSILEQSANIAEERALHTEEFQMKLFYQKS